MGKRTLGLFPLPMRVVGDVVLRLLHCGFSDFFHGFATAIQLRFTFFAVATFRDVDFKFTFCAAIHIAIFGSFHDSFSFANVKIRRTSPLQGFPANKSVELIDVRTPVEFRDVHVDFARNVPLYQLDAQAIRAQRSGSESEPVYVFAVPEVAESRPATSLPMQT